MGFDYIKMISEKLLNDYKNSGYEEIYPSFTLQEIMLPMKDGVKLKTRIYKPADEHRNYEDKPLPVILERTCYPNNEVFTKLHAENLTKRGYIFVSQYCRGTGGSEGSWEPNINERADGLTTVKWLNDQDWVDAIGYWGNSYLSLTGWAIADQVPEKVKGMCLTHYGTDRFTSAYEKGMFHQDVLTSWAMENTGFSVSANYMDTCKFMPQVEVDEKLWGKKVPWYRDWITNTHREDEYWQQGWWKELSEIPAKVKVPLYIRSGWYDHHHGSSMKTWDNLTKETKDHCWLDIGGWNHGFWPCLEDSAINNLGGSEALAILEWFDLVLKQKEVPSKRYRTYMIGADQWIEQNQWPAKHIDQLKLYFQKNIHEGYSGILVCNPDDSTDELSFEYNPDNPVTSHGAESLLKNMRSNGSLLQPAPGYREDVLSFVSEVLEKPVRISGKMKVNLYISTDCEDTAFTAKVMEVRENGKAYNIRSSIASVSHGLGYEYQPGTVVEVTIDMWDIVYEIKEGSRLRIDISSSDFPQYHIHSNYAGVWSLQNNSRKALQHIYCGKEYPTSIEIPYSSYS